MRWATLDGVDEFSNIEPEFVHKIKKYHLSNNLSVDENWLRLFYPDVGLQAGRAESQFQARRHHDIGSAFAFGRAANLCLRMSKSGFPVSSAG